MLVALLGLLGDTPLPVPELLDIVGGGEAAAVSLLLRLASLQFHCAHLVCDETGPGPKVILLLRQQMPAQHRELPRHGNRGYLMTTPGADADEESVQRTRRLSRCPGRGVFELPKASGQITEGARDWWSTPDGNIKNATGAGLFPIVTAVKAAVTSDTTVLVRLDGVAVVAAGA